MKFTKMNGLGNDYIFINADTEQVKNPNKLSIKLSDLHRSIGGDGIVLLQKCNDADLFMRIFNADGTEGLMCGNALRCSAKYAYEKLGIKKDKYLINTKSGIKTVEVKVQKDKVVCASANLGKVQYIEKKTIYYKNKAIEGFYLSVGNPHFVIFVDNFPRDLEKIGKFLNNNKLFPDGINIEFVLKDIKNEIVTVRVYERGSGETMSCGTGACASFFICRHLGYVGDEAVIHLRGGDITCQYQDDDYYISGTVEKNFEGEIEL